MSKRGDTSVDPVGTTVSEATEGYRRESPASRAEYDRVAAFEQLARIVIMRRAELDLSQEELASRMGTTASTVSCP